jgi:hypothetical protein
MTKTITKVVAALGVVAGLGVATLPLSSYAAAETVEVQLRINTTTGSISPDCGVPTASADHASTATVAAGVLAESNCYITGSSNTGITINIKDTDGTALGLTGYSDGFQGATPNGSVIAPIGAQLTDTNFTIANISSINSGAGGWGYQFVTGSSTGGLAVNTANVGGSSSASLWNAITGTDRLVASSAGATTMTGASFNFRTATPTTQAAGYYSNTVTITVATTP